MTDNDENDDLRSRSGFISDKSKLVSFLYELMRDHITPGQIESLVRSSLYEEYTVYTNGWLAEYAQDLAKRLQ